jgi:hypothetical protein
MNLPGYVRIYIACFPQGSQFQGGLLQLAYGTGAFSRAFDASLPTPPNAA